MIPALASPYSGVEVGFMKAVFPIGVFIAAAMAQTEAQEAEFGDQLARAAIERTQYDIVYDSAYVRMSYPMGDVAPDRGVCADVVIRALRALDIDLQQLVHEDMRAAFDDYPSIWGLSRPDANIDHRRVPNLETFLTRKGARQELSEASSDFKPGDIIAWNLRGDHGWLPHIGVVTGQMGPTGRPMVVHNIGAGPKLEDVLFDWPITGHYRVSRSTFEPGI